MEKKLMLKKIIIAGCIVFFVFSYIRQSVTMNRIQKEINTKQLQLDEVKQKMRGFKMKLRKSIQIHQIILRN